MSPCPDRDRLERLLARRLGDTELDEVEQHIEGCAACQQTLEELTGAAVDDLEPGRDGMITLGVAQPGLVVDPPDVTFGAATENDEPKARVVPAVAGYELRGELGRGGMGVVYEARHVRLNRPCALKMILAGAHAGPEDVARFVTEAEAIARLQHPSIVQIRHIGDSDGLPFLELEYVAGGSLDRQLDGTPWPATRAARLTEQVALGIAEAHRQGIVHRDLKPSNVLLAADGTPKVGDFGLAKMLDSQAALTRSESVMGSPSYMAPEQARGHAKDAGPAVDVYAVGAILYELLTGRPPFRGTTALETIEQVKATEPVPPSRLVPGVPRDVETICLKCLQKEPARRFETALSLAEDLGRFLDGRPILARRTGGMERAWRWCRRNRLVAGLSGIAASAILILVIGATLAAVAFRAQDHRTRETLLESLTEQARALRFSRQAGQRFGSLDALERANRIARELKAPPERFDRIRDQVIAALAVPDLKATGRVIDQPAETLMFCFDAGMKRYALRLRSGLILVRRVDDDAEVARLQALGDREIFVFAFSPDGRYLMSTDFPGYALTVWDVDRKATALTVPGPVAGTAARFSPDGRRIAVAHPDGEVLVCDLETGRRGRFTSGLGDVQDLAFRADGIQIAVTGQVESQPEIAGKSRVAKPSTTATRKRVAKQAICRILEVESGGEVRTLSMQKPASVAWSLDGTTLAMGRSDLKIDLWDVSSGMRRTTLEGTRSGGLHATFHPAGNLLVSNGWENGLRLWDTRPGGPVLTIPGENPTEPSFSSSGQIVLRSESRLTTYQVDPAVEFRAFINGKRPASAFHRPSIRNDHRLLAVGTVRGFGIWDLARGTMCDFLEIGAARQVQFEATGDLLTSGAAGIQRWPVHLDADRKEFRIGPPQLLSFPPASGRFATDRSGRIIATPRRTYADVLISERLTHVRPLDDCRYIAVSPDGEWLATGSHRSNDQVWRIRGTEVDRVPINLEGTDVALSPDRFQYHGDDLHFEINSGTTVAFSPDGKWLMTARPPCKLWMTGTWALSRELGGTGLCFSPDSRMVALLDASRIIRLVEAQTGRVIARLESPDPSELIWATFSPDGSRLVLVPNTNPVVSVWDLRAIRKRLAAMDLDWVAPAYPVDDPAAASLPPLPPLHVDLGAPPGSDTSPNPPRP